MRVPLVALVGRPNVGKSTLFNRLVGRRVALVHNEPGVTRDRLFGVAEFGGRVLQVVDTGGFEINPADSLVAQVREQTQLAIDEADLVLLVLDAASGLMPADQEVAALLRKAGRPTLAVANKIDLPEHEERLADLYGLGLDPLMPVSAEHGRGVGDLLDYLCERLQSPEKATMEAESAPLPVLPEDDEEGSFESRVEWQSGAIRVAVVGRPNAGKSSLVNTLLGQERLLATDVPGTTRDAVDTPLSYRDQQYVFVDTAGIRRRRSIRGTVEHVSVMQAMRSIERADVVLVVLDTDRPLASQDGRIVSLVHKAGKGLILVANKWDLMPHGASPQEAEVGLRRQVPFVAYAPMLRVSAKTGRGVNKLFDAIDNAQKERHRRVSTGALNRFFKEVVDRHPPPVRGGKRPRLYFVSQPLVRPPTFIFSAGRAKALHFSYIRYLENQLRERFGFGSTPIWLKFRE